MLEAGGKSDVLERKSGNISETRNDRGKITMESLYRRNSPTLFRTVPSPTPYGFLFPRLRVRNPTQNFNRYYLRYQGLLSLYSVGAACAQWKIAAHCPISCRSYYTLLYISLVMRQSSGWACSANDKKKKHTHILFHGAAYDCH